MHLLDEHGGQHLHRRLAPGFLDHRSGGIAVAIAIDEASRTNRPQRVNEPPHAKNNPPAPAPSPRPPPGISHRSRYKAELRVYRRSRSKRRRMKLSALLAARRVMLR